MHSEFLYCIDGVFQKHFTGLVTTITQNGKSYLTCTENRPMNYLNILVLTVSGSLVWTFFADHLFYI